MVRKNALRHAIRAAWSAALLAAATSAWAQVSLGTTIDLALRNSNTVAMAQADLAHAAGAVDEAHAAYIPNLAFGTSLAYTNGFPLGDPAIVKFNSNSLLWDQAQRDFIRSAKSGAKAAAWRLADARQQVILDAVESYTALNAVEEQLRVVHDQEKDATDLLSVVQERIANGVDARIELTKAQLAAAQAKSRRINLEGQAQSVRLHLQSLTGVPAVVFRTDSTTVPSFPPVDDSVTDVRGTVDSSAAVQAAYSDAAAKRYQAFGQHRVMFRPEIDFIMQDGVFSNNINDYAKYYNPGSIQGTTNNVAIGIRINVPVFDMSQRARIREAEADRVHAERQADQVRDQAGEDLVRLQHNAAQAAADEEVARLSYELSESTANADEYQAKNGTATPNVPAVTEKDVQNARISERANYLSYITARQDNIKAQLAYLKQTGKLEEWAKRSLEGPATPTSETAPPANSTQVQQP
jgi:outer membrane protein TolC